MKQLFSALFELLNYTKETHKIPGFIVRFLPSVALYFVFNTLSWPYSACTGASRIPYNPVVC